MSNSENRIIIKFEDGILGFEDVKEYILVHEDEAQTIWYLEGEKDGIPSLVVVDPTLFFKDYSPVLSKADSDFFKGSKELCFLSVAVLKDPITDSVINLKSPIIIDVDKKIGRQVILENVDYPVRYKMFGDK